MKKYLLSIAAMACAATASMANDYTMTFDGDNDMYGYPRQTTTDVNLVEFVPEIAFTEAGIDFSITKISETGVGFALVNAGGYEKGIYVYSGFKSDTSITPEVTLTVPGGKISRAKVYLSGEAALNSLSLFFNGTEVYSEKEGAAYYWLWDAADEGVETLKFTWENRFYARFINSIELTYTEDLGGKQACGLAFSEAVAEVVLGEDFAVPTLANPNDLPVVWSSSDEEVATVDADGKVTPLACGKTIITVATEGNGEFAAGSARYELSVIPSAANIAQMNEVAPELYDRVKVNFPMTVTFANGAFAFVVDADGNAGCIDDIRNQGNTSTTSKTLYKVGEVIPAGWIAVNATIYGSVIWEGIPDNVTETVEVEYPVVKAVTPADVDRVVVLEKVTFTTPTPTGNTKAFGTTPDGKTYEFQDTYGVKQYAAGTYDVTAVVRYSVRGTTEYFYLAPIAYAESNESGIVAVSSENSDAAEVRYYNLQGSEVRNPVNGVFLKVAAGKVSKVIVK